MFKKYKDIIILFIFWRLSLLILGFFSQTRIPDNVYTTAHLQDPVNPLLNIWVKWDSVWFYEIIKDGYVREGLTAFFPLYPITVRFVSKVLFFLDPIFVGLLLSTLFLFSSCVFFYKLLRLDYDEGFSMRAVFYLLMFPSALFFTLIYSESLFLLLAVSAFYFARQTRWGLASLCGILASLTRVVGIFLVIPLLFEYLERKNGEEAPRFNKKLEPNIILLFLVPVGLLIYMVYLYETYNDPLIFLHVQKDWGRFSETLLQSLLGSLSFTKLLFFLGFALGSAILYKWIRKSYGVYVFLNILPPLISGSFMSINRHFAVLFPIYILFARLGKNRLLNWGLTLIFVLFLAYSTILYVNAYWVG